MARKASETFIPFEDSSDEDQPSAKRAKREKRSSSSSRAKSSKVSVNTTPWVRESYSKVLPIALHQEILDFARYIAPTPEELRMRKDVVARVRKVVLDLWPKAEVKVFGSYKTGLFLPTSDIDMVAFGAWPSPPLHTLARALRKAKIPEDIKVISKARVPIIKFRDAVSRVNVDISFNMSNGPEDAEKIQEYLNEFPTLRPLVLVVKQFLAQRGMNEVFTGGLGSYAVLLMVLSLLQRHSHPTKRANLGILLIEFFELYGLLFNYETTAISVRDGGSYFSKKSRTKFWNPNKPSALAIENPREPDLDVTGGSFMISQIRQSFAFAYRRLTGLLATRYPAGFEHKESMLSTVIKVSEETARYRQWISETFADGPDVGVAVKEANASNASVEESEPLPSIDTSQAGARATSA